MSEHENELKQALAANGNFDAEKAKRLGEEAISWFDARLKRSERVGWIFLLLFMAAFEFAGIKFQLAASTKAMIGYAIVMLLTYGIGVVVKMFSGMLTATLRVLKEIKLLRMENLGRSGTDIVSSPAENAMQFRLPRRALSWWETLGWILALLLVVTAIAFGTDWTANPGVPAPRIETYLTLAPDGTGTEVMKVSYVYMGFVPRSSFPFTTGDTNASIRWVDNQGRQLPATFSTSNGQRHYIVELVEPVMPGEQVRYTQVTEFPASATEKDGLWTCRTSLAFGDNNHRPIPPASQLVAGLLDPTENVDEPKASFWETIQLPKGAEFVTTDPHPVMQGTCIWGGVPARGFGATRGRNDAFACTVQYRLPKESIPSKTAE
ncbi:MAG: DUF6768 family protein [Thermoguttaceae bacterium]